MRVHVLTDSCSAPVGTKFVVVYTDDEVAYRLWLAENIPTATNLVAKDMMNVWPDNAWMKRRITWHYTDPNDARVHRGAFGLPQNR